MNSMQDLEELKEKLRFETSLEIDPKVLDTTQLECLIDRFLAAEKSQEVDVTPLITDHQGRPMTYWGGKSNQNTVAQSRDSAEPMFQAAASGLWYENPMSCGEVSAITVCGKTYKLPQQDHIVEPSKLVEAKQDGFVETSVPGSGI